MLVHIGVDCRVEPKRGRCDAGFCQHDAAIVGDFLHFRERDACVPAKDILSHIRCEKAAPVPDCETPRRHVNSILSAKGAMA